MKTTQQQSNNKQQEEQEGSENNTTTKQQQNNKKNKKGTIGNENNGIFVNAADCPSKWRLKYQALSVVWFWRRGKGGRGRGRKERTHFYHLLHPSPLSCSLLAREEDGAGELFVAVFCGIFGCGECPLCLVPCCCCWFAPILFIYLTILFSFICFFNFFVVVVVSGSLFLFSVVVVVVSGSLFLFSVVVVVVNGSLFLFSVVCCCCCCC